MGYYCTVPQCTSLAGKTKNVKFHRFPRDVTMADKWNLILKRGKPYTKYSKVCSLHFTQADYNVTTMGQWKTLSKDAVPSQNLPKLNPDGTVMVIRKSRTVKYREGRKDSTGDKIDKWSAPIQPILQTTNPEASPSDAHDPNTAYRLQALSAIASALPPQMPTQPISISLSQSIKPKKQDAFMQTDPVQTEEGDNQPNNSYSETSDNSFNSEQMDYSKDPYTAYQKEKEYIESDRKYESPKDYTKQDDYMPQTNEEYNKEAEKYALERKSHNGYEKQVIDYEKPVMDYQKQDYQKPDYQKQDYQKPDYQKQDYQKPDYQKQDYQKQDYQKQDYQKPDYQKPDYQKVLENGYQKMPDVYAGFEKDYQRNDYIGYQYTDSVELLRNQQHNLEMLQQQHRVTENQNFFNENHIKQEIDMNSEEEKFMYERAKDQLDASVMYTGHRTVAQQQRLLEHLQHQVKQEPESGACDNVMQPQGSPYYAANGHTNPPGGYYDQLSRPGPELLIAKQNALAAHTQLWQNTMKRPFFYSETPHYSALHRYEDLTRILQ
ncbi:putative mediator of RNA polymerase II transcription subunit 26 isoform X2 [Pectinophora gossypiella]|uniref:putative mediator of RNA polymerase II transcription subunit 26 isoform X2 n=1 Tax=Pectinophora gossypiella TaxID=13191 RepID=UPI00214E0FB1|nr:putative mediator of RNA polymerase II transcription subunit 26 isoform X2 [Pectinophora gossypiella]